MAVIRQRTQVFNKPVGVVRGDVGAQQVGQSIASAALDLSQIAYREAAQQAEEVGKKAGLAQESSKIATLDPDTGMPVAYTPPSSYGTIAARSYQNMIDRRFEESVLEELQARGSEFAKTSSNANQYRNRMSTYVGEMYNANGDGEDTAYTRMIRDAGEKYVASTFATLQQKEVAAAKAALKKKNLIAAFENTRKLTQMIAIGAPADEIAAGLSSEYARIKDMFDTNNLSTSEYLRAVEDLDGLQALQSQNQLVSVYGDLSDIQKEQLKAGIQNPERLVSLAQSTGLGSQLLRMVADAKSAASVPTILSGLDAYSKTLGDMSESMVESAIDQYGPSVSANTSFTELTALQIKYRNQTGDAEGAELLYSELATKKIAASLDSASITSDKMAAIANQLESAQVDQEELASLLGENGSVIAREISLMSVEDRSNLSKGLTDRSAQLKTIEAAGEKEVQNTFLRQVRDIKSAEDGEKLRGKLRMSSLDEPTINNIEGVLNTSISRLSREQAEQITDITAGRLSVVNDAVLSGDPSLLLSVTETELYKHYRAAYELDPSSTKVEITDRIRGLENNEQSVLNATELDIIQTKVNTQQSLTDDEKETLDNNIFNGQSSTATQIITNARAIQTLNNGYVLPTVASAIEAGIVSGNEQEVMAAAQLFEIYSKLETMTEGGYIASYDIMRNALSEDAYAMLSAISFNAREQGREPLAVQMQLNNYEPINGSLDEDILFDLTGKTTGNIRRILDGKQLSPRYKQEILASIRVGKASGDSISDSYINRLVKSYSNRASEDANVVGPTIGEKSIYALNLYFSADERLQFRNEVTDMLMESPEFNDLLTGGTTFDQLMQGFNTFFDFGIRSGQALLERAFNASDLYDAKGELDRARLREGLQVLSTELKYKPIVSSFESGVPRYHVGVDNNGRFEPIFINDEPLVFERKFDATSAQSELRQQRYSEFRVTVRSTRDVSKRLEAEVRYLATRDHLTEDVFEKMAGRKFSNILPNYLEVYRDARKEYEGLAQ